MAEMRITRHVLVLLQLLLEDVHERRYGYDLMKVTGWASGKLYPMLAKLEAAGWLETEVEQIDAREAKRPPRRWYRLSTRGVAMARHEVAAARAELEPRRGITCVNPDLLGGNA